MRPLWDWAHKKESKQFCIDFSLKPETTKFTTPPPPYVLLQQLQPASFSIIQAVRSIINYTTTTTITSIHQMRSTTNFREKKIACVTRLSKL